MITSVTVRVDHENNGELFWDSVRQWLATADEMGLQGECVANMKSLLANDEVELLDPIAIGTFDYAVTSMPGWNDGSPHAPHPLLFVGNE